MAHVSRMDIAGSLRGAFARGPVSREELLEAAERAGASPAVREGELAPVDLIDCTR